MNTSEGGEKNSTIQDVKSSNSHCLFYLIKDPSKAKKVDDMKHKLRMRGLRCHLMYCRNSTRMQVIPLLASRSQALRYLFIRWRLNVVKLKTLIMEGVVEKGSEEFLRTARSYQRDDIFPGDTPLIAYISGQATAKETANTLRQISGAGMLGNISIFHR